MVMKIPHAIGETTTAYKFEFAHGKCERVNGGGSGIRISLKSVRLIQLRIFHFYESVCQHVSGVAPRNSFPFMIYHNDYDTSYIHR